MALKRAVLALWLVLFFVAPAFAIDDGTVTLTSGADIATRRASLINLMYGVNTLPTTLPTVTAGVSDPYTGSIPNVAGVDQYVASMSNGQSNTSLLYRASSPNIHRLVIVNMGHQVTCTWPSFAAGYRTTELLTALLGAGYSVFAMNMPNCGDYALHPGLFTSYGDAAMRYFIEPAVQAMNYWDANHTFLSYYIAGLSGGAWTANVLGALDPRVKISISDAGGQPGVQQVSCPGCLNVGDGSTTGEQGSTNFYTIAGYSDLYLMASYGPGRQLYQFLNLNDDCCYGPTQWVSAYSTAHGGQTWAQWIATYNGNIQTAIGTINPARYTVDIDTVATQHQYSSYALTKTMQIFQGETNRAVRSLQLEPANDNAPLRFAANAGRR